MDSLATGTSVVLVILAAPFTFILPRNHAAKKLFSNPIDGL